MCGIYGEFSFNKPINTDISFKKMNLMAHRGPDGFGFEVGDHRGGSHQVFHNRDIGSEGVERSGTKTSYFLGHRRLSINDLSDLAFQPMESYDRRYSITFNGEIYNFVELKKELLETGCKFKTDHSDTEALLNAYATWGVKCLERLNGMFAFAIYDRQEKTVFMARDRIGEKPLYYEFTSERLLFASELTSIISFEEVRREIDSDALAGYLTFGYVLHPSTIFDGIKKLPPASYAVVDLKKKEISFHKYWDVPFSEDRSRTEGEFVESVEAALSNSVAIRLRADVPVGAFVSGGTDSTLVIKKIKEIKGGKTDVFGADFPGTEHSEREYIVKAGEKYGHNLNIIPIDLSKTENIKKIISVFDEPFDGGSAIAVFELFKEARKGYKVILTGDGGDELFAGYTRYREFSQKDKLVDKLRNLRGVKGSIHLLASTGFAPRKVERLHEVMSSDRITNYLHARYNFGLTRLLRSGSDNTSPTIDGIVEITEKSGLPVIKALQYLEMKTILPGRMLYKVDKFSMYFGVEARTPFLDHNLAELAFSIPDKINVDDKNTKIILKKILEKDFDDSFVYRRKQGFGNPLDFWFRNTRPEDIFGVLLDGESLIYRYIDYDRLHKAFPQIRHGYNGKRANELWRLVVLGHFLENYRENIRRA